MGQYLYGRFRSEAGDYVRVEIRRLIDGGGDHLEEVTIRSLTASMNGNPQEPYRPFSTTSGQVTLSIHRDKLWQRRLVQDMLTAGDHGFGIHIYVGRRPNFDRYSKPVFIGFIDISNLSYDDQPHPYDLQLKFYDGLASLRDTDFRSRAEPYEEGGIAWARSVHHMIFDCLNCIPNIDKLFKDLTVPSVSVNCAWFATNMSLINGDLDNPLEVVAVNPFRWNENTGGEPGVYQKAGKILEDLLARFQLRIYFSGTSFVIEQMSERRRETVVRHSYRLDGSNYYGVFQPGRGYSHDITVDRVVVHRLARGGFGFFPAAKEVKINFNYTNDFSWVNASQAAYRFDSGAPGAVYGQWVGSLITPKYNYDATGKRIAYRVRIRVKSDYLLAYINNTFAHRYVFSFKFMFNDDLVADHRYNNRYPESMISWGENRWVDAGNADRVTGGSLIPSNPNNPDEVAWVQNYAEHLYDTVAYIAHPTDTVSKDDWGQWKDMIIEGYTAPIPEDYQTGNYPLGVCIQMTGLLPQGAGFRGHYEDNINKYIDLPTAPGHLWWSGFYPDIPKIFRIQYEVEDFAVFLVDENKEIITDTATRVYSGLISDRNKKVIEIDTEIGDGPGPLSVSALRVLNDDNTWVLPDAWTYDGVPGEHDIHELQVRELMRFYGEPRRMLTGQLWLNKAPETVYGPPFMYRFHYDRNIFLPIQVSYDFQSCIIEGSFISVTGSYDSNIDVNIKDYEGTDAKLAMKGGSNVIQRLTVDAAANMGVVRTTRTIGIDSDVNNGNTVQVSALDIPPAVYGYFNAGDEIQVTDGETGRQLLFTVAADVLPDDELIEVEEQEVDIELGQNSVIMLYQEHFESQAYTDNRRKYLFLDITQATDRLPVPDWQLPDTGVVSVTLIRKRLQVHIGSSKAFYRIPSWMGYDIDNVTNEIVLNEAVQPGEFVEIIYDSVRLEK